MDRRDWLNEEDWAEILALLMLDILLYGVFFLGLQALLWNFKGFVLSWPIGFVVLAVVPSVVEAGSRTFYKVMARKFCRKKLTELNTRYTQAERIAEAREREVK